MKLVHHWRLIILLLLALWAIFLIHPFSKQGAVVSYVEFPASGMIRIGDLVETLNGNTVKNSAEFQSLSSVIKPNDTVEVGFMRETFPYSYAQSKHIYVATEKENATNIGLLVKDSPASSLKLSHEIAGGNKFIFTSANAAADANVLAKRLKFGQISDYSVKVDGAKISVFTTSGQELEKLIAVPGKFEAKIGNDIYFTADDVKQICTSGVDCILRTYQQLKKTAEGSELVLRYDFEARLGDAAGQRFAALTKDLAIGSCEADVCYLNETIDYYIDGVLIGSEQISSTSKGEPYTTPLVGGEAPTIKDATANRFFIQAILKGESSAKYGGMERLAPSVNISYVTVVIFAIAVLATNAIAVFVRLKNPVTAFAAFALPGLELLTVVGIISGLNVLIAPITMLVMTAIPVVSLVIYNYLVYCAKKDQLINKKIAAINRKWDWWLFAAIIVFFVLDVIYAKLFAPVLVYVLVLLVFSKTTFVKTIKTREY